MSPEDFSFTRMQAEVDSIWPDIGVFGSTGERRAVAAIVVGAALVGIGAIAPRTTWTICAQWTGIIIEAAGIAFYLGLAARSAWRAWRSPEWTRHRFDGGFDRRQQMLAWLRQFPPIVLRDRTAYLAAQREILRSRLTVVAGAVDKLGILPLLVALFLQVRSAPGGFRMTFMEGVFAVFFVVLYAISMWAAGAGRQMEFFKGLLVEASLPVDAGVIPVTPIATVPAPPAA